MALKMEEYDTTTILGDINITAKENFTCGKWNLTSEEHYFQDIHGYWVQSVISIIVSILGSIVNVITILILSSAELKRLFFNKLLICLTVFDIFYLVNSIYESFRLHITGTSYCSFQGHVLLLLYPLRKIVMCCSIYMTLVLTFERYLAVAKPIAHRNRSIGSSEGKRVLKYVSPVIFFSIIYCLPTFFCFTIESGEVDPTNPMHPHYNPHYNATSLLEETTNNITFLINGLQNVTMYCIFPTEFRSDKDFILWYTNVANFVVTGAIPFIGLACLNCKIYQIIQASSKEVIHMTKSRQLTSTSGNPQKSQKSEERRQAIVLFGIVIAFFVCHVLRIILNIEEIITYEDLVETERKAKEAGDIRCGWVQFWVMITTDYSHLLLQINASINFFIYCFFGKQFKKVLKDKLYSCAKRFRFSGSETGSESSFGSRRTSVSRLNYLSTRTDQGQKIKSNSRSHENSTNEKCYQTRNKVLRANAESIELQSFESATK